MTWTVFGIEKEYDKYGNNIKEERFHVENVLNLRLREKL
jgi:hypothetical protein